MFREADLTLECVPSLLESVIMLTYVSRCISVVFMCVCVCVCDVLKNCTVLFAQRMHKGAV